MLSGIKNFFQHSPGLNYTTLAICSTAAAEMGIRTVINLTSKTVEHEAEQQYKSDLSANLSGALFFCLAAANLFPGSRKVAAIAFVIRSFKEFSLKPDEEYRQKEYWTGRAITFFPDQAYQGYQKIKGYLKLPSHPTWYALITLIALVGYYQFGGAVSNYFSQYGKQ